MSKETHHRTAENPRPLFNLYVPITSFLGTFYYIAMPMTDPAVWVRAAVVLSAPVTATQALGPATQRKRPICEPQSEIPGCAS